MLVLEGTEGVDVADVDAIGVDPSDWLATDGNPLKRDLYRPLTGSLAASIIFFSSTKSRVDKGYSPLLS